MKKIKFVSMFLALCLILVAIPLAANAAPPPSSPLPPPYSDISPFAAKVAYSGETISGVIDTTTGGPYDVGIYIGPGVHDVTVTGATVTGAKDEGILVQDATNIVIKDSIISGNGVAPFNPSEGSEIKGIVLAGTTNCLVKNNTVAGNGSGGISVLDDGSNHPFAPDTVTSTPIAGRGNFITNNTVRDNFSSCGIVVSAKNPGGGLYDNFVSFNTVTGFDPLVGDLNYGAVGGIVVAGGAFGSVKVMGTRIIANKVDGGYLAGISVHGFNSAKISGTQIVGNVLSNNGPGEFSGGNTTGIDIAGPGVIQGTSVHFDTVSHDYYGVWCNANGTSIVKLQTDSSVTIPIGP